MSEMILENLQIDPDDLAKIETVEFRRLNKKFLQVTILNVVIFDLIALIALVLVLHFAVEWEAPLSLVIGIFVFLLLFAITILEIIGFQRKKYAIRSRDVLYTSGVLWKRLIAIPFNRVQHCEVLQGPVEKIYGLGKVKVFTAGGTGSDLAIPGLLHEDAHAIRQFILKKTVQDEEE